MHLKDRINFDEINALVNSPLVNGDTWYLIDRNWFNMCKAYNESGDSSSHPGPIDNSALFQAPQQQPTTQQPQPLQPHTIQNDQLTNGNSKLKSKPSHSANSIQARKLRDDLEEAAGHFVVVPEKCWNILTDTYGLTDESCTIKRRVVEVFPSLCIVEMKPLNLKLCLYGAKVDSIEKEFSRLTTLDDLHQEMRKLFNVSAERETTLWVNSENNSDCYTFSKPQSNEIMPSKSENNLQSPSPIIKPPPTPPPLPNTVTSSNNISSPTVITRQAANYMNKPIALPDISTSPTTRSFNLSTSTSDSPISSTSSAKKGSTNQTLTDALIADSAVITLEVMNQDGTWPSSKRFGTVSTRSSKAQPGLCGLSNMGNTCFMNAALQCLSNTPSLTNYILTDKFVDDINPNNPLGMHGEIARTYAELIKVMWSGNNSSFVPREFKCAVSRFAPQFNGFAQQDCQELMAFLLDGLHEDLNRIRNKPYIETKNEIEKRPDEVVAEESWSNYKKRNDSIVVDTFHAMLKSTLVCPGCKLVSVTFDPFCYLSLPLPVKREKQTNLTFISAPGKIDFKNPTLKRVLDLFKPEELTTIRQYGCSISSFTGVVELHGCYMDLYNTPSCCKLALPRSGPASEICDIVAHVINEQRKSQDHKIDSENLVVAEISTDGRICKVYEASEHYNQLGDDIVVVEKKSNYVLPLYLRERKNSTGSSASIVSKPLFLHVPDLKFTTLYKSIIASLSDLVELCNLSTDKIQEAISGWHKIVSPNGHNTDSDKMECEDDDINPTADSNGDNYDKNGTTNHDSETNGKSVVENDYAFELCITNSYGNHVIETLKPDGKERDYSSKLYLGVTFTNQIPNAFHEQFNYLNQIRSYEFDQTFTPKVSPKPTLQLKDCISQFTSVEKLGADDPWYCPKCKKHQQATKKFDIWSLPEVLIIHLKRFSFSRSWRDKIDTLVEFPVEGLDMSKYVLNTKQQNRKQIYNLIGVSNHFGGLGGGHYTAYAKNAPRNSWYSFDDALVAPTSSNNVVTRSAYVLFYQLQDSQSD